VRSADVVASATRWIGRGQPHPALAREIAWIAVRATAGEVADLRWLVPIIDGRLAEAFIHLPVAVRRVSVAAERRHLATRPYDREGAQVVGEVAAFDAAVELLCVAYMDALDCAVGVLRSRRALNNRRGPLRQRLSRRREADELVQCEVPERILDGLSQWSTRPGWAERDAA
jgi:hypothetical protein